MTDILINSSRIKYDILNELFDDYPITETTVNFFIDFHDIVYRLYKQDLNADVTNDSTIVKSLVVSIINTIAHYRRYLSTKLKKNNRIFIIFNKQIPDYQSKQIEYGRYYYDRYSKANANYSGINKALFTAIDFIKEMVQYFENIYFIESNRIEEVDVMRYLFDQYPNSANIVMSRNELNFQLVNYNDNVKILYPDRDKSKIFNKRTLFDFILSDKKFRPSYLTPDIYPLYLTMMGLKKRDVDSVTIRGVVKLLKCLDLMVENQMITNKVSINQFVHELGKIITLSDFDKETIIARYKAISCELSVLSLTETKKKIIDSNIVDLYDQNGLVELNDSLGDKFIMNLSDLNKNKRVGKIEW